MKKYIFVFFLLSNAIYGMEHRDTLGSITEFICREYKYNPKLIRKNIRALYETNKFLHDYYAQEKNAQKIVRLCASRFSPNGTYIGSNDQYIAQKLRCHAIRNKIHYLSTLVRDKEIEFAENDLKDVWYLNCTTNCCNRSLLYVAIDHNNFDKARLIIKHSPQLDFRYSINENPLSCVINKLEKKKQTHPLTWPKEWLDKDFEKTIFEMVELLLQKKIDPNITINGRTQFKQAVYTGNKDLFRLLLRYANPFKGYTLSGEGLTDTIEVEVECTFSGWALDIIEEMNIERDKT